MKLLFTFTLFLFCSFGTTTKTTLDEDHLSRDRSVIRFLIDEEYIVEDFIYQWERIERRFRLRTITTDEFQKKVTNEATLYKALRKYQEDNNLSPTGIIDNRVLKKVFGDTYTGRQAIDGGGIFGDYNAMKSYGEDDPNIGKAPKFMQTTTINSTDTTTEDTINSIAINSIVENTRRSRRHRRSLDDFAESGPAASGMRPYLNNEKKSKIFTSKKKNLTHLQL